MSDCTSSCASYPRSVACGGGECTRRCGTPTIVAAVRERIRIVHISLQRTHVHLLVEARDAKALSSGMQGFQISAARNINTTLGDGCRRRRGRVFADRYHLTVIKSPTQARHAISYVLSNWRKHGEDKVGLPSTWLVDPFSSGVSFPDWKELEGRSWMWPIRDTYDPLFVRRPASWILRQGWKRAGAISAREVPSKPESLSICRGWPHSRKLPAIDSTAPDLVDIYRGRNL